MSAPTRRLILCIVSLLIGCSSTEPAGDADESNQMLGVLTTALDSWKLGTASTLSERQPPIRFADDDLSAGRQLLGYRLEEPDMVVLPFESVYVTLTLQVADGKTVERKVGYQVSLEPGPVVLRSEP